MLLFPPGMCGTTRRRRPTTRRCKVSGLPRTVPGGSKPLVRILILPVGPGVLLWRPPPSLKEFADGAPSSPSLSASRRSYVGCETIPMTRAPPCFLDTDGYLHCLCSIVRYAPNNQGFRRKGLNGISFGLVPTEVFEAGPRGVESAPTYAALCQPSWLRCISYRR